VNVEGATRLARAALESGVRRFVFISSIGVLGNRSDHPLTEADTPSPVDLYACSKHKAELQLARLCAGTSMDLVILRPTLVYGPGCPGNLQRLMRLLETGLPLPFGAIDSRRAMIGIETLTTLIEACVLDPRAAGETFVAADDTAPTLPELVKTLAEGMGRRIRLVPVQKGLLLAAAGLIGRAADIDRLTSPLLVDASKARRLLGWRSQIDQRDGLLRTGAAFARNRR
jgi:nucleoside-diphosphate-sugar epimerase